MTDLQPDHIVIIEHPAFYETFVIALVSKVTDKSIFVQYWNPRRGWSEEPARRKIGITLAGLGHKDSVTEAALNKAWEQLKSWRSEMIEAQKAAVMRFHKKARGLGGDDE